MDVEDDAKEGSVGGGSTVAGFRSGQRSPLEVGTLAILTAGMERLAPVLARDALDGSEIWKTVAYTTLESLVTASREDRSHRLLAILSKNGYLQSFVQSLKVTEEDLLNVLAPDPGQFPSSSLFSSLQVDSDLRSFSLRSTDNFNSLYVFEAKSSLLVRIAQSQFGAERILESRLFEVLSQCHFIDVRPEMDQTYLGEHSSLPYLHVLFRETESKSRRVLFADLDSFLPPVIERYHQILLPTLQLAVGTLSSLGPSSHAALHQVRLLSRLFVSFLFADSTLSSLPAPGFELHRRSSGNNPSHPQGCFACPPSRRRQGVPPPRCSLPLHSSSCRAWRSRELPRSFPFSPPSLKLTVLLLVLVFQGLPSGFGAYHLALLGLGGRFFLREKWEDQLVPVNDSERADAETPAPGSSSFTLFLSTSQYLTHSPFLDSDASGVMLFDYNADRAVEDLNKSLLSYFVLATESSSSSFFFSFIGSLDLS